MAEKACAFTGHRTIPLLRKKELKERLEKKLVALIEDGFTTFIAGGALGFDTLAEEVVLELKKEYPLIKLRLSLPCPEQDSLWKDKDRAIYRDILKKADSIEYISQHYTDSCMLDRNRRMVDSSDLLIAFYDGRKRSGTAMTVNYATKKGVPVFNLF